MSEYSTTISHDFEIYYQEDQHWSPPAHSHDFYEIFIVVDGYAELNVEGKRYQIGPRCIAFLNRFENHDIKVTQYPYCRYVLSMKHLYCTKTIKEDTLLSVLFQRPDTFHHIISLDDSVFPIITDLLKQTLNEYQSRQEYQSAMIAALLNIFFVTLYREAKSNFPVQESSNIISIVTSIQHDISSNYNQPLVLDDLETRYFVSKFYICRSFKKITGYTIKDYLTRQRIAHAKSLLVNTNQPVAKISEACGYNSVNHFNRIFQKKESMSPAAYRKNARQQMRTKL